MAFSGKSLSKEPGKKGGAFFIAYAYCAGKACTSKWKFFIPDLPKPQNDVKVDAE